MSEAVSDIADRVIRKCGGEKVVSDWLGIDLSQVYKYRYPKSRGGTGGLIPACHHAVLIEKAREAGKRLTPSDFFPKRSPESVS